MEYQAMYREKRKSAQEAAMLVNSGDWVDFGWSATTPVALDHALAKRMGELHDVNFRGGLAMWPLEIFKLEDAVDHFTWNSWHMSGVERRMMERGFAFYACIRYSELPRYYRDHVRHVDVAMFQVPPMDEKGYFNFGLSTSHLRAVCDVADKIVVEVNENMPQCNTTEQDRVHISEVTMVVEGENPAIVELPSGVATDVDRKVAELIVEEIPNGACLQLGIGGMPNTVGQLIAESDLKDLGVNSEMYVDAFVDLALAGKINGKCKTRDKGLQVYSFATGTKKMYDYLHNNKECIAVGVDYSNDPRTVAEIDNFMSINNAVDVDLFGQVNSESAGLRHISGAGGQLDFVMGAYLSKGGKSFVCCSSSFKDKKGNLVSRIRPTLAPGSVVTDVRPTVHWFVTEYGKVSLKGLSSWQRAEALISLAHPKFRDELIADAEKMGIWKKSNKR